jgi:hypothetical protein
MPKTTIFLSLLILSSSTALTAQQPTVDLEAGDSVRFVELRRVEWQNDAGVVIQSTDQRLTHHGRVLGVRGDSLLLRVDARDMHFALSRLDDLEVHQVVANPRVRAFKKGGAIGGGLVGGAALILALCSPSIGSDGGCQGPSDAWQVTQFTLMGAVIGAVALGSVAALLTPDSAWESVERFQPVMNPDGSTGVMLRYPVSW